MLEREQGMINKALAEDVQQLRWQLEQLKHLRQQDKNISNHKSTQLKQEASKLEARNRHLEDLIFDLAETGEITPEIEEIISQVEERKGITFKKNKTGNSAKAGGKRKNGKKPEKKAQTSEEVEKENQELKKENAKLKNQLGLDSTNSSLPPSSDEIRQLGGRGKRKRKGSNQYNDRPKSSRRKGAQKNHPASGLNEEDLIKMLENEDIELIIENLGEPGGKKMLIRYVLDLKIVPVIREIHINGDTPLPKELQTKVNYGNTMRSIAVLLETDGLLSLEKTRDFLNYLSGGTFKVSLGTVYGFIRKFQEASSPEYGKITADLIKSRVVYTDSTKFRVNKKASYVRNHSTKDAVLYLALKSKKMDELKERSPVLLSLDEQSTLVHDHEVGLYHFPTHHGECHVHLKRDLKRVQDETGHDWAAELTGFFWEAIDCRKELIQQGVTAFTEEEKAAYRARLEDILDKGRKVNQAAVEEDILPKEALQFEKSVLKRFENETYRKAYLRFMEDFEVAADNNLSERDLRKVVVKRKQITCYRAFSGLDLFCKNLSVIETIKRGGTPLFNDIFRIFTRNSPSLSLK